MKKYFFLTIFGLALLYVGTPTAKASVVDYINPSFAGPVSWSTLSFSGSPTPNQAFVVGSKMPVGVWANTNNYGSYENPDNCSGPVGGSSPDNVWLVVSDGPPANPATLANTINIFSPTTAINAQFIGHNFRYLGRMDGVWSSWIASWPSHCVYQAWLGISSSKTTPSDLPNGQYSLYAIINTPRAVMHETITITNVSYLLSVNPTSTIIGPNGSASYSVDITPQRFSTFTSTEPATFWTSDVPNPAGLPYSSTPLPYWDSPVFDSQYKPGDTIHISAGNTAPALTTGGRPRCASTSGSGLSIASALISDGIPMDVTTLTPLNIGSQFAGKNYRSLGQVTSTDSWMILGDCSVTFSATAAGDKTVPTNAAICSPSGSLIPLTSLNNGNGPGHVWLFVIFQGDVGSFVGYQEIVVTNTPSASPPTSTPSIFNSPVTLSHVNMTLDPSYYNTPTYKPANPALADLTTLSYPETTMTIQTKSSTALEEICPAGCSDFFGDGNCYTWGFESLEWCGSASWESVDVPTPAGAYTFNVQGISGLPLAGIKQISDQIQLIVSNTPPPPPPQIGGVTGGPFCPSVKITWSPIVFDPAVKGPQGYRIIRLTPSSGTIARTIIADNLATTTTSYTDNTVNQNYIYEYMVESFNANGSNDSKPVPVRTLFCPAGPLPPPPPVLSASCSPSSPIITNGSSVTWSAGITGGTGPYTYSWSGDNGLTGTGSSVSWTYNLPSGSSTVRETANVSAQDSIGNSSNASCSVTVGRARIREVNPR